MMDIQQFPREWAQYRIFFLPKDSECKSYRPISMANCLCKVLERLIANRMNWFLEYYDLLPVSQFGFRAGRSCIDNLAILQANVASSLKVDRTLNSVFLDIKSAYDRVIPDILIQKLVDMGLAPKMIGFIQNNINNREVFCEFDTISEGIRPWVYLKVVCLALYFIIFMLPSWKVVVIMNVILYNLLMTWQFLPRQKPSRKVPLLLTGPLR